jgi:hypothetical protein
MKFKSVNKLFTLIIYNKLFKVLSYKTKSYYNSPFLNEDICTQGDSSGSKSPYGSMLHSKIWMLISNNQ